MANLKNVQMSGMGVVTNQKEEGQEEVKISLPPLPEGAIEFNPLKEFIENVVQEDGEQMDLLEGLKKEEEDLLEARTNLNLFDEQELAVMSQTPTTIIDESKIVTDPTPTPSNKPAYKPEVQDARLDTEDEGGIANVVDKNAAVLSSNNNAKVLDKKMDNKDVSETTQDALHSEDVEGGIVPYKSTGNMRSERPEDEGGLVRTVSADGVETDAIGSFTVYGFDVQYIENGVVVTKSISDTFKDMETALVSVNRSKYLMPKGDAYKLVDIVSGIPRLSDVDRDIYVHAGNSWKRS